MDEIKIGNVFENGTFRVTVTSIELYSLFSSKDPEAWSVKVVFSRERIETGEIQAELSMFSSDFIRALFANKFQEIKSQGAA